MANQIIAVLDYPALQDLLWTAGGEEVRKITWQAAAQKCVNLYEETLTR
jgi:glycosyltransferase involved in cell wall biosynthesis